MSTDESKSPSAATRTAVSSSFPSLLKNEHLFLTGQPGVGKTTIIKNTVRHILDETSSIPSSKIRIRGFYSEECRGLDGNRVGFDIVYWPPVGHGREEDTSDDAAGLSSDTVPKRAPLARSGMKIKKGDPTVGKYLVDIESIARVAVPSIDPMTNNADEDEDEDDDGVDLVVLDEIGKMELLCPSFLPAVKRVLDSNLCSAEDASPQAGASKKRNRNTIVFGTIPTPKYGRIIQAVEDVRARDDVTVLQVTKSNRDELGQEVQRALLSALLGYCASIGNNDSKHEPQVTSMKEKLRPYLYERPIGPSSEKGPSSVMRKESARPDSSSSSYSMSASSSRKACGPLIHETIPPKVLLLGETASPVPRESGMEYSERTMWTVLGIIFGVDVSSCHLYHARAQKYKELKNAVLSSGIAVWDVLSDIHEKGGDRSKRRKQEKNKTGGKGNSNKIEELLDEQQSIIALAFIGQNARQTFGEQFGVSRDENEVTLASRQLRLVLLPSSSRANSRISIEEKASQWKMVLSDFCPAFKG